MTSSSPPDALSARVSLFHRAVIYAKEGSLKLVDGRWNFSQSEAKLGIKLSPDESNQLMACTGEIVCVKPAIHDEDEDTIETKVTASAVSVLRPDLLVTAKHVFFKGKKAVAPFGNCSFRSYSRRKVAVPVVVEKDQRCVPDAVYLATNPPPPLGPIASVAVPVPGSKSFAPTNEPTT